MYKRKIPCILALVTALTLAGCAQNTSGQAGTDAQNAAQTTEQVQTQTTETAPAQQGTQPGTQQPESITPGTGSSSAQTPAS